LKDHLGDTRATYAPAATGLALVAEYQHYYSFGLQAETLWYTRTVDPAVCQKLYSIRDRSFHKGKQQSA